LIGKWPTYRYSTSVKKAMNSLRSPIIEKCILRARRKRKKKRKRKRKKAARQLVANVLG